jgi:hypothetical protein
MTNSLSDQLHAAATQFSGTQEFLHILRKEFFRYSRISPRFMERVFQVLKNFSTIYGKSFQIPKNFLAILWKEFFRYSRISPHFMGRVFFTVFGTVRH